MNGPITPDLGAHLAVGVDGTEAARAQYDGQPSRPTTAGYRYGWSMLRRTPRRPVRRPRGSNGSSPSPARLPPQRPGVIVHTAGVPRGSVAVLRELGGRPSCSCVGAVGTGRPQDLADR